MHHQDSHPPRDRNRPNWHVNALHALAPTVWAVELDHQKELDITIDPNHPWLVLDSLPLPQSMQSEGMPVLLAWQAEAVALYLPQQHLLVRSRLLPTLPAPDMSADAGNVSARVALVLREAGWVCWQQRPIHASVGEDWSILLQALVQTTQALATQSLRWPAGAI